MNWKSVKITKKLNNVIRENDNYVILDNNCSSVYDLNNDNIEYYSKLYSKNPIFIISETKDETKVRTSREGLLEINENSKIHNKINIYNTKTNCWLFKTYQYIYMGNFYNGISIYNICNEEININKVGLINRNGKILLEFENKESLYDHTFHYDIRKVNGNYHVIDESNANILYIYKPIKGCNITCIWKNENQHGKTKPVNPFKHHKQKRSYYKNKRTVYQNVIINMSVPEFQKAMIECGYSIERKGLWESEGVLFGHYKLVFNEHKKLLTIYHRVSNY